MLIKKRGFNLLLHLSGRTPGSEERQKGWTTLELGRLQENGIHLQCNNIYIYMKIGTSFFFFLEKYKNT